MRDERCKCSIGIALCGDGCRYCQPQGYIDKLWELIDEERQEHKELQEKMKEAIHE